MAAVPINYVAVLVAAIAGFLVGWGWYAALGKAWLAGLGKNAIDMQPRALPFVIAFLANLLMAYLLAGLLGHLQDVTVRGAVITALFVWAGFLAAPMLVNHQFQGVKPIVTVIDAGHWLAALVAMAIIIGAFGV
jgi:hypothetical protein